MIGWSFRGEARPRYPRRQFERKPIGRPWVTLAIDVATRMVMGYKASFEAPSRLSVALCLTRAVAPKAELLANLD